MPSRTRTRSLTEQYSDLMFNCASGCTSQNLGTFMTSGGTEVMDDVVVPRYHEKIAQGAIINNPCNYDVTTYTSTGVGNSRKYSTSGTDYTFEGPHTEYFVSYTSANLWPSSFEPAVDAGVEYAKQQAVGNIDNTPFAFGEDVLELRETLRFLRNPLGSLFDLSRSFKRTYRSKTAKLSQASDLAQAHASVWLQYRFAVGPLVRSTMDALEAYSDLKPLPPARQTARGFAKDSSVSEGDLNAGSGQIFSREWKKERDTKASILYEVSNPIHDWKYKLGFRMKDVPTTLWQVVPYSFMVDRAYDVTSFFEGVINMLDPNVKILAGSVRVKSTDTKTYQYVDHYDDANWTRNVSADKIVDKHFVYNRAVWHPSIGDALPVFRPKGLIDDSTKLADLVAITIANFAR